MNTNPHLPYEAEIIARIAESPNVFTLHSRFCDAEIGARYQSQTGQFNMIYLYGVGEVPISIMSHNPVDDVLSHTIRAVGRVTNGIAQLQTGNRIGIRGPYGRGWPLAAAHGKDVVLVLGGLGCAPAVSVIHHILAHRDNFGRLVIMQGVKHSDDLIWRQQYESWSQHPNTQVLLAADVAGQAWPWLTGRVTQLLEHAEFDHTQCIAMMCGPEIMMEFAAKELLKRDIPEQAIWLSMERNMQCAVGQCGHCQYGGKFICKDGPVFCYSEIKSLFGVDGF